MDTAPSTYDWQEQARAAGLDVKPEGKGWRVGGVKVAPWWRHKLRVYGLGPYGHDVRDVEVEQVVETVQEALRRKAQRAAGARAAKRRTAALAAIDPIVAKHGGYETLAARNIIVQGSSAWGITIERRDLTAEEADAVLTALLRIKTEGK